MIKNKSTGLVGFIIVAFAVVVFLFLLYQFMAKEDGEDVNSSLSVDQMISSFMETEDQKIAPEMKLDLKQDKDVSLTNDLKHTVPLSEIVGGGPAKDGIPSIDKPKFISVEEAGKWLGEEDPGIMVSIGETNRFYPFQILVWHEIVNDLFDGKRVLVTYCPLCLSGIVFDPIVQGERVEFGTSGKLWNSNLVMYDRKTDSYWSQVLGESIVGEMAGTKLPVLPSDQIRFGEFAKLFPQGEVLSKKTGIARRYGSDPYGDYYTDNSAIYFPLSNSDSRLDPKEFVLGVVFGDQTKAYVPKVIKELGEVEDRFAGKDLVIKYEEDIDAVRIYEKSESGDLKRINPITNFWFSWVAVHPDTEVFK